MRADPVEDRRKNTTAARDHVQNEVKRHLA